MSERCIFVVDDDESVRDAIGMLLDSVDLQFELYASASDFLEGVESERSGVLVLDIRMPGMSGLELQDRLIALQRNLPIVFITGHGDIPMAVEAMRKGAVNFIRKPFRDQELLDCIQEALDVEGRQRLDHAEKVVAQEFIASLTPRETEVFELVCQGLANKVIASDLNISERTVEIHRGQVMQKSGQRSLAQLVRLKLKLEP